jgi:hypothetical protein
MSALTADGLTRRFGPRPCEHPSRPDQPRGLRGDQRVRPRVLTSVLRVGQPVVGEGAHPSAGGALPGRYGGTDRGVSDRIQGARPLRPAGSHAGAQDVAAGVLNGRVAADADFRGRHIMVARVGVLRKAIHGTVEFSTGRAASTALRKTRSTRPAPDRSADVRQARAQRRRLQRREPTQGQLRSPLS